MFSNGIFLDHSKLDDFNNNIEYDVNNDYLKFKSSKSNSVMICADKYREGSDIEYLDMIVFADYVKTKSELPFIQCVGRVQRKGYNKTHGTVIDHYDISKDHTSKTSDIINKLLGYYYQFFSVANSINNNETLQNALNTYADILSRYKFNHENNQILINLDKTHNIIIHTKLSEENFLNIKNVFVPHVGKQVSKQFKLAEEDTLRLEYELFRQLNQTNIFYQFETKIEYENKVIEYNLEPNPAIKYAKYNIWTNWYDYLGIDTSIYPTDISDWRKMYKKHKIKNYKTYLLKAPENGLPLMPEELYKIKSLVAEFMDKEMILM